MPGGARPRCYGCYALLAKLTGKAKYQTDIERHLDYWTTGYNGNRITYTPGGLAYLDVWGALRYSANTSFLAAYYADMATTTARTQAYNAFAANQMAYMFGDNPQSRSYVCGYGANPPVNPHHRTAHGSWSNNQNGPPEHTRHVLYGALVGGPNNDDSYEDDRSNYVNNEVACDYNACFSGLLASFVEKEGGAPLSNFPVVETPGDEYYVEAKFNAQGTTYSEWAVWVYNHTAWPARLGSEYQFQIFLDISEGVAAGYSAADYVVSSNNAGIVDFTELQAWDEESNIYYTEVTFKPTIQIWPGGQGESRMEAQMRIRLPYEAPASAWDPTNDWSSVGVDGTLKQNPHMPMYVDGELVYGQTPSVLPEVEVAQVNLDQTAVEIDIQESFVLNATVLPANATNKSVTWSSSNTAAATVSASGLVTGVATGEALITVQSSNPSVSATCAVTVSEEVVVVPEYDLTITIVGEGSVTPTGGTFEAGTLVNLTAVAADGFLFEGWSGAVTGSNAAVSVEMTGHKAVTATFLELTGGDCDNPQAITIPFSQDGEGEFCWVTSQAIGYINSWNLATLEINGVDFTNTWSNSLPEPVNGQYFIYYKANYPWSHFEIPQTKGSEVSTPLQAADSQLVLFKNPFKESVTLNLTEFSEIKHMAVTDLSGRVLETIVPTGPRLVIGQAWKAGTYLLSVQYADRQLVYKMIKQ
ncbi:MAG: glycoside hydrolase family 9 protein [Bacteroidales bacterium]|nr:glycoside hydrolase family 9 protein [Bacteroidales bacterium]